MNQKKRKKILFAIEKRKKTSGGEFICDNSADTTVDWKYIVWKRRIISNRRCRRSNVIKKLTTMSIAMDGEKAFFSSFVP